MHSVEINEISYYSNFTMRTFQEFSATQMLREINFGHSEAPKKLPLWPYDQVWFLNFWIFLTFLSVKFPISQNSKPPKLLKWQFLALWIQPKLISRQISMAGKLLNFVEYPQSPQSKFPIRLPRSVREINFDESKTSDYPRVKLSNQSWFHVKYE